jgi:hypothetical protein
MSSTNVPAVPLGPKPDVMKREFIMGIEYPFVIAYAVVVGFGVISLESLLFLYT